MEINKFSASAVAIVAIYYVIQGENSDKIIREELCGQIGYVVKVRGGGQICSPCRFSPRAGGFELLIPSVRNAIDLVEFRNARLIKRAFCLR